MIVRAVAAGGVGGNTGCGRERGETVADDDAPVGPVEIIARVGLRVGAAQISGRRVDGMLSNIERARARRHGYRPAVLNAIDILGELVGELVEEGNLSLV